MSLESVFYYITDTQIEYLSSNKNLVQNFIEGTTPRKKQSFLSKLFSKKTTKFNPSFDWPNAEQECFIPEINHRMIETMHFIINDTKDPVSGSGNIFHCGMTGSSYDFIALTNNSSILFCLSSMQLKELDQIIGEIDKPEIRQQLVKYYGEHELEENLEIYNDSFSMFKKIVGNGVALESGLMWECS